jgi:acyl carrier protein
MNTDIQTRCLAVLKPVLVQEGELAAVAAGGTLYDSGSLDSLTLVNLVVALENEFSLQIDAENIDQVFATLDSLVAYLAEKCTA